MSNIQCVWTEDEDEEALWHTSCGNTHDFQAGGPEENGFKFCPYCGHSPKQESNPIHG